MVVEIIYVRLLSLEGKVIEGKSYGGKGKVAQKTRLCYITKREKEEHNLIDDKGGEKRGKIRQGKRRLCHRLGKKDGSLSNRRGKMVEEIDAHGGGIHPLSAKKK